MTPAMPQLNCSLRRADTSNTSRKPENQTFQPQFLPLGTHYLSGDHGLLELLMMLLAPESHHMS